MFGNFQYLFIFPGPRKNNQMWTTSDEVQICLVLISQQYSRTHMYKEIAAIEIKARSKILNLEIMFCFRQKEWEIEH